MLKAEFERLYAQIYGLTIPGMEAEAVTWSVTVSSPPRQVARAGKRVGRAVRQAARQPRHL